MSTSRLDDLAALATMSPAQLRKRWTQVHRTPAPPLGADLLMRGIAYRLQEKASSGLSSKTLRELDRLASRGAPAASPSKAAPTLRPGTRLVRSWQRRTYAVLITEEGFTYEDRAYSSLTEIAREITGTNWSGPRFFGLTRKKAAADA